MNLSIDSFPCFYKENIVFYKNFFSNLVFGDDFSFNGIIRMYHDLFCILGKKGIKLWFEEQEKDCRGAHGEAWNVDIY